MILTLRLLIISSLCFFSNISLSQNVIKGKAINVYDGDTFTLIDSLGGETRIRIASIDAPEKNQPHGIESRDFARKLIENKIVTVYLQAKESYGRKIGIVITEDGKHFSYEMAASGNAWHYAFYSKDKFMIEAQKQAKKKNKGLWQSQNPIPPWDWRKLKKTP